MRKHMAVDSAKTDHASGAFVARIDRCSRCSHHVARTDMSNPTGIRTIPVGKVNTRHELRARDQEARPLWDSALEVKFWRMTFRRR